MRPIVAIFVGLLLAGCSKSPSMQDIRSYGEQKFIDDVLAVAEGKLAPESLLTRFRPLRVEAHLGGAWLVYAESASYQAGIYVDRKSVMAGAGAAWTSRPGQIGLDGARRRSEHDWSEQTD